MNNTKLRAEIFHVVFSSVFMGIFRSIVVNLDLP